MARQPWVLTMEHRKFSSKQKKAAVIFVVGLCLTSLIGCGNTASSITQSTMTEVAASSFENKPPEDSIVSIAETTEPARLTIESTLDEASVSEPEQPDSAGEAASLNSSQEEGSGAAKNTHLIAMEIGSEQILISLNDTEAANALYEMLPLELTFEDFRGMEKLSYLPEDLPTGQDDGGCAPIPGDLCLYVPWDNITFFYQSYHAADDLVLLGRVQSGLDLLTSQNGTFMAALSKVD